jgi:nicotinamidase-related amidase
VPTEGLDRVLRIEDSLLLVIDVQEKLFKVIDSKDTLLVSLQKLIKGCRLLDVPVILTEQNPAGLGPTLAEIAGLIPDAERAIKFAFSCCAEAGFNDKVRATGRRQVIICGIESHVCVYQTTLDLLGAGYEVNVVGDAVSSRTPENRNLALRRLSAEGAKISGVEMALFELLRTARAAQFKAVSALIKE